MAHGCRRGLDTGLNCAAGDYCVVMDDDLQNPPQEVSRMLAEVARVHVSAGSRVR